MADTDEINNYGIQVQDYNTLLSNIQQNLTSIISTDGQQLSFDSNSPDGQITNILSEIGTAVRELAVQTYNSTIPANCEGQQQDKMYDINYLTRKAGSFSLQQIDIVATKTVTLQGLDGNYDDESATAYGVKDDSGNVWYLVDTTTVTAGTTSLMFRASLMGEVLPIVNTINQPINIISGISSVNNNVGYSALGELQESNQEFRIRRDKSPALAGGNSTDATVSKLLQLSGVTSVQSYVNPTAQTDPEGVPATTAWYIVLGGANTDIADIIYNNQGGGDTKGDIETVITTISGQPITVRFDRPISQPLYIKFNANIKQSASILTVNTQSVAQAMVNNISYDIGETAYSAQLVEYAQEALVNAGDNAYCTGLQISQSVMSGTLEGTYSTAGLTATCDWWTFEQTFPYTNSAGTTGTYTFQGSYANDTITWDKNGDGVPSDFGITITGTPTQNSFTLVVKYTAPTWSDICYTPTLQYQFVTDTSKIWINVVTPNA